MNASAKKQTGFTIVELLIVIVVIAILAAISIVAYTGIQNRANDTTVQSDLKNVASKLEIYKVDNERFPNSFSELTQADLEFSPTAYAVSPETIFNLPYCTRSTAADFVVAAKSRSGKIFTVSNTSGVRELTTGATWSSSTPTGDGVCTSLGFGGAITHGYYGPDGSGNPWRSWTGA